MSSLLGPFLLLALALIVSGSDKMLHPDNAAAAIRAARLSAPTGPGAVSQSKALARLLGVAELVIGTAAIAVPILNPSTTASMAVATTLGATYLGFAWFVTRLRATDAEASCGCFGAGAPPGPAHRWFNAGAALIAGATVVAIATSGSVPRASILIDAGVGATVLAITLLAIGVPLFLIAPSLLAGVDPRNLTDHAATVPTFAVTVPISSSPAPKRSRLGRGGRS